MILRQSLQTIICPFSFWTDWMYLHPLSKRALSSLSSIQINGDAVAGYTQCQPGSRYMHHLLSYWPSLWVTAEIWSVMRQNKSVSQRLLARSRGGVHYDWFYRCPSIPMCLCVAAGMVAEHGDRVKKSAVCVNRNAWMSLRLMPSLVMAVLFRTRFIAFFAQQTILTTANLYLRYTLAWHGRVFPRWKEEEGRLIPRPCHDSCLP